MRYGSIYHDRSNAGFTLLEVMLATTILLFIVAALTQAVVSGQMHAYESIKSIRATTLIDAMLDEVLSKPYDDPDGASVAGPEAGEADRDDFDNCDDYDGYVEAAGSVEDMSLTAYGSTYQQLSRSVTATYTTQVALGQNITGLLVTVSVTDANGRTWSVSRFVPEGM